MKFNEDLHQFVAILLTSPQFTAEVDKFRRQFLPLSQGSREEVQRLMLEYNVPSELFQTILNYLHYNEVFIPTGYGFRYEKDPITNEWAEHSVLSHGLPIRQAQQALSELNKLKLLPRKRMGRFRASTQKIFERNLHILQLKIKKFEAKEIADELAKTEDYPDEGAIGQVIHRAKKLIKHDF